MSINSVLQSNWDKRNSKGDKKRVSFISCHINVESLSCKKAEEWKRFFYPNISFIRVFLSVFLISKYFFYPCFFYPSSTVVHFFCCRTGVWFVSQCPSTARVAVQSLRVGGDGALIPPQRRGLPGGGRGLARSPRLQPSAQTHGPTRTLGIPHRHPTGAPFRVQTFNAPVERAPIQSA